MHNAQPILMNDYSMKFIGNPRFSFLKQFQIGQSSINEEPIRWSAH